jgi:hypothetical protein
VNGNSLKFGFYVVPFIPIKEKIMRFACFPFICRKGIGILKAVFSGFVDLLKNDENAVRHRAFSLSFL